MTILLSDGTLIASAIEEARDFMMSRKTMGATAGFEPRPRDRE